MLLDHAREALFQAGLEAFNLDFKEFLERLVIGIGFRKKAVGVRGVHPRFLNAGFYGQSHNDGIGRLAAGRNQPCVLARSACAVRPKARRVRKRIPIPGLAFD